MPAASLRAFHSARGWRVVSTSVAMARRAPTVACSSAVCANGSQSKNRQAFFGYNSAQEFVDRVDRQIDELSRQAARKTDN